MEGLKEKTQKTGREITLRCFKVLESLIEDGIIKNKSAFSEETKQERSNFTSLLTSETRYIQPSICEYLVSKYFIDGTWLLTGKGSMFRDDKIRIENLDNEALSNRAITNRGIKALDTLAQLGEIESAYKAFLNMGYSKSTLSNIRANEEKQFSLYTLHYIVDKFNVNGTWLLSGFGNFK